MLVPIKDGVGIRGVTVKKKINKDSVMWLACQKKSYLICDKITNFQIFTQPIPNFFLKYKTETAKQGRDSCLKKNKCYIIFQKFVILSHIK